MVKEKPATLNVTSIESVAEAYIKDSKVTIENVDTLVISDSWEELFYQAERQRKKFGDFGAAIQLYEKSISKNTTQFKSRFGVAECYKALGWQDSGKVIEESALEKAIIAYDDAVDHVNDETKKWQEFYALYLPAEFYRVMGNSEKQDEREKEFHIKACRRYTKIIRRFGLYTTADKDLGENNFWIFFHSANTYVFTPNLNKEKRTEGHPRAERMKYDTLRRMNFNKAKERLLYLPKRKLNKFAALTNYMLAKTEELDVRAVRIPKDLHERVDFARTMSEGQAQSKPIKYLLDTLHLIKHLSKKERKAYLEELEGRVEFVTIWYSMMRDSLEDLKSQ